MKKRIINYKSKKRLEKKKEVDYYQKIKIILKKNKVWPI